MRQMKGSVFNNNEENAMSIKEAITAHNMSQETLILKRRINRFRERLVGLCNEIEQDAKVQYTGWFVLLKETEGGFESLGVFNPDISESETEPEWDLCLPIPEPESFRDFMGW
jgi:hypothetical protein